MKYNTSHNSTSSKTQKRKHPIIGTVIKVNGRTVGQVINGVYVKDIMNRHMLKNPEAIANDIQALHDAEHAGAAYCEFTNIESGIIYRVAIAKIWDMGKRVDFGWGEQIMLTLQNWTQTRDPEYTAHTDTDAPAYSDSDGTHEDNVKPLNYKSHAITGIVYNGVKVDSMKQLNLFGAE